jgi:hypothetical protein
MCVAGGYSDGIVFRVSFRRPTTDNCGFKSDDPLADEAVLIDDQIREKRVDAEFVADAAVTIPVLRPFHIMSGNEVLPRPADPCPQ